MCSYSKSQLQKKNDELDLISGKLVGLNFNSAQKFYPLIRMTFCDGQNCYPIENYIPGRINVECINGIINRCINIEYYFDHSG